MLQSLSSLIPFTMFWAGTVIVPGLNFVLVSRTSALHGRQAGLAVTLGIGIAVILWGIGGFLGIHALFEFFPNLELFAKIIGGLYLVWIGIQLIRHRNAQVKIDDDNDTAGVQKFSTSFFKGFFCCLSNPDVLVFTTSLFVTCFPANAPLWLGVVGTFDMFVIQVGWMALVALCLSAPPVAKKFQDKQVWIDAIAGGLFIVLGGLLVFHALKPYLHV